MEVNFLKLIAFKFLIYKTLLEEKSVLLRVFEKGVSAREKGVDPL